MNRMQLPMNQNRNCQPGPGFVLVIGLDRSDRKVDLCQRAGPRGVIRSPPLTRQVAGTKLQIPRDWRERAAHSRGTIIENIL